MTTQVDTRTAAALACLLRSAPAADDLDAIMADADFQAAVAQLAEHERAWLRAIARGKRRLLVSSAAPAPAAPTVVGARRAGFMRLHWRPTAYVDASGETWCDGLAYADVPFRATEAGKTALASILDGLPPHIERVYLCGPRPGGDTAPGMRAWFTDWLAAPGDWTAVPPEWRDDARGRTPVLRVARTAPGTSTAIQRVEVRRMEEWFPEDAGARVAQQAMRALSAALRDGFGSEDAIPAGSPAQTGLRLWDRTQPTERFDPLPRELRTLIHETSGQGRQELLMLPEVKRSPMWYVDGRLAYAALCWELPDTAEVQDDDVDEFAGYRRGRYLVRFTVPADWSHVGLLGVWDPDGHHWTYPAGAGETHETWCDGAELQLAIQRGWGIKIRRRLLFTDTSPRRPLDTWARKLVDIRSRVARRGLEPQVQELVERGIRSIILHGIGRFSGGTRDVVRYVRAGEQLGVPKERVLREEPAGDGVWRVTIQEDRAGDWSERHDHPEWSAAIWGRQRRRLLSGPGNTGMLHMARRNVLACYVDALYFTQDPQWPDDGKPGRFRVKGYTTQKITIPRSWDGFFRAVRKLHEQ